MDDLNLKQLVTASRQRLLRKKTYQKKQCMTLSSRQLPLHWRRDYGEREQEVRAKLNTNDGTANVFITEKSSKKSVVQLLKSAD